MLDGDAFGLAGLDDALLVRGDALRGVGDSLSNLSGSHRFMLVAVQQVAGIDPHASHLHRKTLHQEGAAQLRTRPGILPRG